MKELRLPNGEGTTDIDKFSDEWNKIRKPFEDMGFRVIGFDPGIALCDAEANGGAFNLPLYAAKRIAERMPK